MRKIFVVPVLILLMFLAISGCQAKSQGASYTDDAGRTVTLAKVPQRLISHVPSITETLFALGLGDRVVGVSDYCDYPPEAKQKPSVGNYFEPSIEKIVALEPDLVFTDGKSDNIQQLDGVGIPYVVIDPQNIDQLFADFQLEGKITGAEAAAQKLVGSMQQRIANITGLMQGVARPKVFYIIDAITDPANPWTAGKGSFIDSLITKAGGDNIAGNAAGSYLQFSLEQVVSDDPDIIIIDSSQGIAGDTEKILQENPVWSSISAVKNGKIYEIDGSLTNPCPRIVDGLETMAKIIHPEKFN